MSVPPRPSSSLPIVGLALQIAACTLPPTALDGEGGDELGDASDSVGESEVGETESDTSGGEGELLPDCIAGTTLDGSSVPPPEYGFEGDVVVCASGFGHTAQPLAIDWTLPRGQAITSVHELDAEVRLLSQGPGIVVTRLDLQGELLGSAALPVGPSHWLSGSALDEDGRIVLALESVDESEPNRVAMLDPSWTSLVWSVEVGDDPIGPVVRSGDDFLVARIAGQAQVVRVSASGEQIDVIPTTLDHVDAMAATPSGFMVASDASIEAYHADGSLAWLWSSTFYSIDAMASASGAAIVLGQEDQTSWVARIDGGELTWSQVHERSELWHPIGAPDQLRHEQTQLMWLAALADGTFVVAGPQYVETPEPLTQTFVVHFDAEGNTLAQDRPFVDAIPYAIGGGSAAYVWMSGSFGSALRRYQP